MSGIDAVIVVFLVLVVGFVLGWFARDERDRDE